MRTQTVRIRSLPSLPTLANKACPRNAAQDLGAVLLQRREAPRQHLPLPSSLRPAVPPYLRPSLTDSSRRNPSGSDTLRTVRSAPSVSQPPSHQARPALWNMTRTRPSLGRIPSLLLPFTKPPNEEPSTHEKSDNATHTHPSARDVAKERSTTHSPAAPLRACPVVRSKACPTCCTTS